MLKALHMLTLSCGNLLNILTELFPDCCHRAFQLWAVSNDHPFVLFATFSDLLKEFLK